MRIAVKRVVAAYALQLLLGRITHALGQRRSQLNHCRCFFHANNFITPSCQCVSIPTKEQGRKGVGVLIGEEQYHLYMQNRSGEQLRKESNDWLGEDSQNTHSPAKCNKQSPKSPNNTPIQKTQRIKKHKKERRASREETRQLPLPNNLSIEERLVSEAIGRLRVCHSRESVSTIPIYKKLTRQRLLEFLEMIEAEYSLLVSVYLGKRRGSQSCGNLKGIFLRFIDGVIAAFPVLNNIVFQYAFQYYTSGPLQARFGRLMDKNITPILKLMSEKYNRLQQPPTTPKQDFEESTHFSHSPQRSHLEQFEIQDNKKSEKRRRQRDKKREGLQEDAEDSSSVNQIKVQTKPVKVQIDHSVQQLINFMDNLSIEKQSRNECRIEEQHITRWKALTFRYISNKP